MHVHSPLRTSCCCAAALHTSGCLVAVLQTCSRSALQAWRRMRQQLLGSSGSFAHKCSEAVAAGPAHFFCVPKAEGGSPAAVVAAVVAVALRACARPHNARAPAPVDTGAAVLGQPSPCCRA
ncbi:hypothetical protein DUNSADRAFT_9383 [Dunaliella salina]|uniref:Secreted protein n=1 Tax=Dunaliella salina TaxID=3046 RepID=A0ABQ7GHM5_DUNSA|nr:hypothetical protein DUNSADRAFT_9383 [Dunaliella salina]|eukprot:KAF5834106.1 hypothetical protein DUNSADRAFT_9383 [Dunaliella salina]